MSKYTTGEVAALCSITVRTVQYYDNRGLLSPSELSEGGRRLYSESDLRKMKIVCFLRELGFPLSRIADLLREEHPERVIRILIEQQQAVLSEEIKLLRDQSKKLDDLAHSLKNVPTLTVESIGDMAHIMKQKKQLKKVRLTMFCVGLLMDALEIAVLLLWILHGLWWPFALAVPAVLIGAIWISRYYFREVSYICPACHAVFRPKFKEAFWANHTPNTRKLTCPECHHKGYCIETIAAE